MLRRRVRVTVVAGAVVTLGCIAWALRPIEIPKHVAAVDLATSTSSEAPPAAVQTPLVAARLWNPPPVPVVETTRSEEAAPSAPRYTLIGIIHEEGELKAALYDPGTDRILIVRSGDSIEGHTVVAINERSVELSDGTRSSTITLKEERS